MLDFVRLLRFFSLLYFFVHSNDLKFNLKFPEHLHFILGFFIQILFLCPISLFFVCNLLSTIVIAIVPLLKRTTRKKNEIHSTVFAIYINNRRWVYFSFSFFSYRAHFSEKFSPALE